MLQGIGGCGVQIALADLQGVPFGQFRHQVRVLPREDAHPHGFGELPFLPFPEFLDLVHPEEIIAPRGLQGADDLPGAGTEEVVLHPFPVEFLEPPHEIVLDPPLPGRAGAERALFRDLLERLPPPESLFDRPRLFLRRHGDLAGLHPEEVRGEGVLDLLLRDGQTGRDAGRQVAVCEPVVDLVFLLPGEQDPSGKPDFLEVEQKNSVPDQLPFQPVRHRVRLSRKRGVASDAVEELLVRYLPRSHPEDDVHSAKGRRGLRRGNG
jgi:hypothetical protein